MKTVLTEANFLVYAAQHYDNVFSDTLEFYEDLKRIVYIKRLFNIYLERGELKERLILNHLIILYNMFGNHATSMLFLKLQGYESLLKTFLCFINRMPDIVPDISTEVKNSSIPLNTEVWKVLKKNV